MSEKETGLCRRIVDHTRTVPLAGGLIVGLSLFLWKYVGKYPEWHWPLDLKEHARHPILGMGTGYVGGMASELTYDNPYRSRGAVVTDRVAAGLLTTFVVGAAIEVGLAGPNTFSLTDMAFNFVGAGVGILCVKSAEQMNNTAGL